MSAEKAPPWAKLVEEINALPTADPDGLFDALGPSLHAALPGLAEDFKRAHGRVAGFVVYLAPNLTFGLQTPEEVATHLRGLAGVVRPADERAARLFEETAARLESPPPALEQFVPFVVIARNRAGLFMVDPEAFSSAAARSKYE